MCGAQMHPARDYQFGSLRDDFNFDQYFFYKSDAVKEAVSRMYIDYKFVAMYDLRLKVSQKGNLEHINEFLYYDVETDTRKSGENYLTTPIQRIEPCRLRWSRPVQSTSRR